MVGDSAVAVGVAELEKLESSIGFQRVVVVYCSFDKDFAVGVDSEGQIDRYRASSFDHNASNRHC